MLKGSRIDPTKFVMMAATDQLNKYRWGERCKTDRNDPLHKRAEKLLDQVRDADKPVLDAELKVLEFVLNGEADSLKQHEHELMGQALVRAVIPMIVKIGFERYGVSRLTTSLTEFLSEMEPPKMEQVRGMEYNGPHCLAFRYDGREYLAVRFLGYEAGAAEQRAMDEERWNCEFDVAGWTYIRTPKDSVDRSVVRTEIHDSSIDEELNNAEDLPVVRCILYNLMLGWESGIFHEGPTDKSADARPIPSSDFDRTVQRVCGGRPPYRYVHLGPKGEKFHNEQRQMRERMNDPKFRLAHWFVRAHFRKIGDERTTTISAHYKSRRAELIDGDVQPTTVITL